MSLFLALADQNNRPVAAPRLPAQIVHIDEVHNRVWIWVPELHETTVENVPIGNLRAWNQLNGDAPLFASIKPEDGYRGFLGLQVQRNTLSVQRDRLNISMIKASGWPNDSETLGEILDTLDAKATTPDPLPLLKAVALLCSSNNEDLERSGSLQTWLFSKRRPRRKLELGTPGGFTETVRQRSKLFEELRHLLTERRMVHLLAGRFAYLDEFLEGFESHLKKHDVEGWKYVPARFHKDAFQKIYDSSTILPFGPLDALLATLAFGAARGLKEWTGHFIKGFFDSAMDGNPVEFAKLYFRETKAGQRGDHWSCISEFLGFLAAAATAAEFSGKVTVFLPFHQIEEVINGIDDMRRNLWEGLGALQRELGKQPNACPQLGVLLAAHCLPLHKAETLFMQRSVLQIPPLTRHEVDSLIVDYLGGSPSQEAFETLNNYVGGDPWFLYQVLRCLSTIRFGEAKDPQELQQAITKACTMAMSAISLNEPEAAATAATVSGGGVRRSGDTSEPQVPSDVSASLEAYVQVVTDILILNRGALGSKPVLNAWAHPVGGFGMRTGIGEVDQTWLETGLIFIQAQGDQRGDSLTSLRGYPTYQFSQAGQLPLKLAQVAQARARHPKREAS